MRAERLRDALYDVGFQLSTEILSILVLRYMRRDGTLRLGDYVSAILHLTMAFGKWFSRCDFFLEKSPISAYLCPGLYSFSKRFDPR